MLSKKRHKNYIPTQRHNPEVLARKIEKQQETVDTWKITLNAVIKANEQHIMFLSNFLQHDMKNAIHSMDGILSTISGNSVSDAEINSLKTSLEILRQTINNFKDLIPHSQNGEFTLNDLLASIEALTRGNISKEIEYDFNYDRKSEIIINHSYQALLQVLHNIIINATKSMEITINKKLLVQASMNDGKCEIRIADSGLEIPKENIEKIFTYGFSTTGGTGIGLFHAKYVCDSFNGCINLNTQCKFPYTKEFIINFPIKNRIL
jgi:signal transduction histidine kinase